MKRSKMGMVAIHSLFQKGNFKNCQTIGFVHRKRAY